MSATVKVQKVERPTNRSFYVNIPAALADAISIKKGESFVWTLEDKNTMIFSRAAKKAPRAMRSIKR